MTTRSFSMPTASWIRWTARSVGSLAGRPFRRRWTTSRRRRIGRRGRQLPARAPDRRTWQRSRRPRRRRSRGTPAHRRAQRRRGVGASSSTRPPLGCRPLTMADALFNPTPTFIDTSPTTRRPFRHTLAAGHGPVMTPRQNLGARCACRTFALGMGRASQRDRAGLPTCLESALTSRGMRPTLSCSIEFIAGAMLQRSLDDVAVNNN